MNTGNQKVFIVPTSNAGSSASLSSGLSESSNSNLLEDDNVSRNSSSSSSSTSSLLCSDSDDENENNERQEVSHSAIIPGGKDLSAMLSRNKENIENDDEGSEEEENSVTDDVQMKDMIGGEDERENNGIVTTTDVAMEDNKISTNVFSVNSSPSFEDDGDVNMEEVNAVEKEISQREQGKKRNNTNIAKSSPKKIIKLRMAENQEKELKEKQQDSTTKSPTNNNHDKTPLLKKEEEKASDENKTTKKSDEESKKKSSSEKTKKKKKKSKSSNKSKSTQQSESNNANNNSCGSSSLSINHNGFYPVKMPVIVSPGLLVPAVSTNSSSTNINSSNNTDTNNTTTPSADDNLINIKKPSASDKEKTITNKNNNSDNTTNKNTTNNSTSKQLNPSNSSSLYNSEHKITPSNLFNRAIFIASQNNATSTVSPLVIAPSSNDQEEQQQQKQEKQNHEPQHRGSSIKRKVEDMFDRDVMMTPDFPTLLPPEWMSSTYNSKEQIRIMSGEKDDDEEETKYACYSEQTKSLIQDISRYLSDNNNKDEVSDDMECDDDDDANNDKPCLQFRDMVPISLITEYPPSYVNAHKEYTDKVIERERIIEDNQIAIMKAQEAYIQFEEDKEEWTIQMKKIENEQVKQKQDEDKQNEQQQDISSKSSSHQPSCISAMPEQPPNKPILQEIPPIPLEPPIPDKDDVMTTSSKTLKKSLVSSYLDPDFYSKPTRPYFGLLSNSIADPQFIGPNAPGLTLSSNGLLNHSNTLDTARTNNNTVSAHGGGKGNLFYGYYSQAPTHLMISSGIGQKKKTK